jgi:hypothetical protein
MIIIMSELLDVCWRMAATRSGYAKHNTSRNSISLVLRCVQEKVCYQITTHQGTTYLFSYMCAGESLLPDLAVKSTHQRNKDSIDTVSGRSCAGIALT